MDRIGEWYSYKPYKTINNPEKWKKWTFLNYYNIISELFTKDRITREEFNETKKKSYSYLAKSLYSAIHDIDKFSTSNNHWTSLCYKWDRDLIVMWLLPQLFASFKELFIWNKWNSRENSLNRIKDEDIKKLWLWWVNIIEAPKGISDKKIIIEIRNALDHSQSIVWGGWIYLWNPVTSGKHPYEFVASVPFEFMSDFMSLVSLKSQKQLFSNMEFDDPAYTYSHTYNFNEIKDHIHFYKWVLNITESGVEESKKEITLTPNLKTILWKYFDTHKASFNNLKYIAESLVYPPEEIMFATLVHIFFNRYSGLKDKRLIDDVYLYLDKRQLYGYQSLLKNISNESKEGKILHSLWKDLLKKKQPNWQSILKHGSWIIDFSIKYFKDNWFIFNEKNQSREKGNITIKKETFGLYYATRYEVYNLIEHNIKIFPNWLKMQFIKIAYINQLIPVEDAESEHIRNALAHNRYILLDWVDDVLLFDTYDKGSDSHDRENIYSLSKIYEDTYNKMNTKHT